MKSPRILKLVSGFFRSALLSLLVISAWPDPAVGQQATVVKKLSKRMVKQAAKHFDLGQTLYNEGKYTEAITAFETAHRLSPHRSALFNIARCHENLGSPAKALDFYRQSLAITTDPDKRADVEFRIRRLESRPVKVFLSSKPSGASVTVNGGLPHRQRTPTVLQLRPGDHVLLLRLDGHHLVAKRVKVKRDKEIPVEVALEPLPKPCPPPRAPCPEPLPCPRLELVDLRNLHLHMSVMASLGWMTDRPLVAGPALQVHGIFRRVVFGALFNAFPMGEERINGQLGNVAYTKATFRWLMGQAMGGYSFSFSNWYATTTLGLGASTDDVSFFGRELDKDGNPTKQEQKISKSAMAFTWSIGVGAEAMVTRWFSMGASFRFGMMHGNRVDKNDPQKGKDDEHHFPYGTFWGSISFHL